jgi:hypothetical protein
LADVPEAFQGKGRCIEGDARASCERERASDDEMSKPVEVSIDRLFALSSKSFSVLSLSLSRSLARVIASLGLAPLSRSLSLLSLGSRFTHLENEPMSPPPPASPCYSS